MGYMMMKFKNLKNWKGIVEKIQLSEMPHIMGPIISPESGKTIDYEDLHMELSKNKLNYKRFVKAALNSEVIPMYDPYSDKIFEYNVKTKKTNKVDQSKYQDVFSAEMKKIIKKESKK